jgi:hypothetical protein
MNYFGLNFGYNTLQKKALGHHTPHTHYDNHISGFYFLRCSDKTSLPVFHDPRPGKLMTQLPLKE